VRIAIPIFEGITALDAVGPYEVLSRLPDAEVVFVAQAPGPKRTENGVLALTADAALADVSAPDVIVVPGGFGTRALMTDEAMLSWLRSAHATSTWTTSVCTGSLLLAAAGLLDGLRATTHWLELSRRPGQGDDCRRGLLGHRHGARAGGRDRRRRDRPGDPARHRVRPAAAV
jgi:putative intracellular protease/amidase